MSNNNSLIRQWNGKTIRQRRDGTLSLTDMAQACGKRVNDWLRLESTKSYLARLSESTGIPVDQLVEVNESSGSNEERGTWAHRKPALRFAQWCSDDFAIQVDTWIEELLTTGKVQLTNPQPTQAEVDEYHLNLRKLSGVKRLITRLELKYNFNDLHSIVKNFPHHNDLNPFYSYSSIIVNQCYVRVFAGNKLSLSGRLGLEYSRELNIRDHICLESLDALLTFENYLNQAITGLGYNPYDALDIAENLMKTDPKWKHIKLPVECKRAPSITCPSTFSEEDWLNHWKYELTGLERLIQKHLLMFRENSNNPLPIS